jgi:hypothetical protein
MALLKEWQAYCKQLRLLNGDRWQDTGFVFIQDDGRPMHPDSVSKWLVPFCEKNGIPKVTAHERFSAARKMKFFVSFDFPEPHKL